MKVRSSALAPHIVESGCAKALLQARNLKSKIEFALIDTFTEEEELKNGICNFYCKYEGWGW